MGAEMRGASEHLSASTPRRATPSAHTSASTVELGAPDDLRAFRGLTLGAFLGALLWALLLGACASTDVEQALRSYDRAVAQGLATERLVRPYARINDGAPFTRERRVEIDR